MHVLGRREREVAVVDGRRYVGMCGLDQIGDLPRSEWETVTVRDMVAVDLPVANPSWTLRDAVAAMDKADVEMLAVVTADESFVGLVLEDDILKLDEILEETGG